MKKRILALLLAAAMLAVIPACGSSAPSQGAAGGGETEINLWHIYVDESDTNRIATEEFIAEYNTANPDVKVNQHMLQDADYKTKMLTEFSGSASSIDVFTYWGAGRAGDLVASDKLLCVEDYLSDEQINNVKSGADKNFRYDGKLYGFPMASWVMILYCNTELFDQNGVKLPETYDEWLLACNAFAEAGITPVALGGGVDDSWQAAFVYEALANRIVGSTEEMNMLNSMSGFSGNAGFAEAADKVIEMSAIGAFGNSPLEIDEMTANVQFLSGAAAMRLTGSWFTSSIYTDQDSVVEGKVKGLAIPMVPGKGGEASDYVGGFIDGIFVNKSTEIPDIAVDFAYNMGLALGTHQHEIGEGFTAYNSEVDESGLTPLGKEIADMAATMGYGVVAWDTFLPGDVADMHLGACQALLAENADTASFLEAYTAIFN